MITIPGGPHDHQQVSPPAVSHGDSPRDSKLPPEVSHGDSPHDSNAYQGGYGFCDYAQNDATSDSLGGTVDNLAVTPR